MENIKLLTKTELFNLLVKYQNEYTNNNSLISDDEFDYIQKFYETKYNEKFEIIGSLPETNKVNLEYFMPSLNKIKGKNVNKGLNSFKIKFNPNYCIQDKLDGCSLQYHSNKNLLYTRGNGEIGKDVSFLLKYIKLPKTKKNYVIRGELVLSKINFDKYISNSTKTNKKNKNRSMVSGIVNSDDESLDKYLITLVDFICYEIQNMPELTNIEQLEILKKSKFSIPSYKIFTSLTNENLTDELLERREISEYDIDGLVITCNNYINNENINKNPEYKIAFKLDTFVEATVIDIEWNITSKIGKINPVIIIEQIKILNTDVNRIYGNNARYIFNNKIGKNAILLITLGGDIIPNCVDVIEPSKKKDMIYPNCDYTWDENNVDFIVTDLETNKDVIIAKFHYFIKTLDIKEIGIEILKKLYENGIKTFKLLFEMVPDDIKDFGDKKIGIKTATKICDGIKKALTNSTLAEIMAASCIFNDFGIKSFQKILDVYPDLLEKDYSEEDIDQIPGFDLVSSIKIIENLPIFIKWLGNHPQIIIKKINKPSDLKYVVFSGFTKVNEEFDNNLKINNFELTNSITKKVSYLIVKDKNSNSGKINNAVKFSIPIFTIEEFIKNFFC